MPQRRHSGALAQRANPATVLAVKVLAEIWGVGFDQCVGCDEQFSGDGDEGDLAGLSLQAKGIVVVAELGMVAGGDQGGHVERGPGAGTAAGDRCAGRCRAGLADVWRQPRKAGDGLAIALTELG